MGYERQIKPVEDNFDKRRTYAQHKGRYKKAMENEFYFEALLIDYAILEDRLRSMLYHMGFIKDRKSSKIWKAKAPWLREILEVYIDRDQKENTQLGINSITGKVKIIRCVLKWAACTEGAYKHDSHLRALKSQCESLDIDGLLSYFEELQVWCKYRNEVIHCLMNKNLESLSAELKDKALFGMQIADFFDAQEKILKKGNVVRKAAKLSMN